MKATATITDIFSQYAPTLKTYYDDEDGLYYCEYLNKIVGSGKFFVTARIDAFSRLKKQGVIPESIIII